MSVANLAAYNGPSMRRKLTLSLVGVGILVPVALGNSPFFRVPPDDQVIQRFGKADRPSLDGKRLRVLVWNVYKGKRSGWVTSYRELARDKDLVLLQEAYLDRSMRGALQRPGLRHAMAVSFRYRRQGQTPTGVLTGAVVRPSKVDWLRSRSREPVTETPKMSLLTRYPLSGSKRPLTVINVHAINFVRHAHFARMMGRVEKWVAASKGPVLLAGDFNTWSSTRMRTMRKIASRQGLSQVPLPESKLDHVFLRGLDVASVKYCSGVKTSDHKPIVVELRLPD